MKTGINFERCKVGSAEMHNTRDPKYIAAVNASPNKKYSIFEDRTETNVSWINPKYSGKDLPGLLDELRNIYKSKVGQAPQEEDRVREITDKKTGMKRTVTTAGWSPIREGVCPIREDTTIKDFEPFIEWLQVKGLQVVRLDLHHDEGHTDELSGERKYNHHAHIIVDWTDHDTGKTRKLSKIDASEMQTQLAASLSMERGVSKKITGADHLSPDEQRAKAAAENARNLEDKVNSLTEQKKNLEDKVNSLTDDIVNIGKTVSEVYDHADKTIQGCCRQLQFLGRESVKNFDFLCKLGAVNPTDTERQNRDRLEEESNKDLSQITGSELLQEEKTLRNLILHTALAIERIGRKLQELAKQIPFWKKSRLAHEAELQARVAAAEEKAVNSTVKAVNAVNRAKNAEEQANEREREAQSALDRVNARIDDAYNRGRNYEKTAWNQAFEDEYKPAMNERDELKKKVEELETRLGNSLTGHYKQALNTAKELQRKWGPELFERAGLGFTRLNSWQTAKEELQKEQQQQERSNGVHW